MVRGAGTKRAKISPSNREVRLQTPAAEIPELHDRIATRAYEIFEEKGRTNGHDWEDWFRAEQEVLGDRMDADFG
jgi:hypothetical protein